MKLSLGSHLLMIRFKKISLQLLLALLFLIPLLSHAQTADELKDKINERTENIRQLEEEIKAYQGQIDTLGKEADSLKNTLASLDLSRKKLEANLVVTQNKIENTNLEIKQLSLQIDDKSARIADGKRVVAQALASISQTDEATVFETLLSAQSLAEAWNGVEELTTLQASVRDRIHELQSVKVSLESNKAKTEEKKRELVALQKDLANQKKVLAETVREKNTLLAETKNSEANYKKILAERERQKAAFEKEVLELESSLKFILDPNSIPKSGSGVLRWPVDRVKITQYYGNTEFATRNPSVYKGTGHNGIDFNASLNTPVRAAASGVVTDVVTNGAQRCGYGNWVMIKHLNGLSTLYAHLSVPTTAVGSTVSVGQVIGYSGNTGFTTGPHLHFGVYVTKALQTVESKACPGIIIPAAAFNAQLNPLSYL